MVGTIVPVGNGQGQEKGESYFVLMYLLGSLVGAAAMGWMLTSLGVALRHSLLAGGPGKYVLLALGVVYLVGSAREVGLWSCPLPQSSWQVPRSWLHSFGDYLGVFAFGSVLGFGFFNPVVCVSFYAVVLWIVVVAGRGAGIVLALAYAVGRVMPVLVLWYVTARSRRSTISYVGEIDRLRSIVYVVNGMVLAGVGSLLLTVTFRR